MAAAAGRGTPHPSASLTPSPQGEGNFFACGRGMGRFVPRHEYLSFIVERKVPKKAA